MKIRIYLKIFIFIIIFLITDQITEYGILMLFAFIHELGHLFVGLVLKFKPDKLDIMPYGLSISFKTECEDYNRKIGKGTRLNLKKMLIAIAGPLTNFIIALIFIFLNLDFLNIDREVIVYSNILVGVFNLIPIYPLDGGRITKEILHMIKGLEKSYSYTNQISRITVCLLTAISSILILYIKNIALIFILVYLWYLVIVENIRYNRIKTIYEKIKMYD